MDGSLRGKKNKANVAVRDKCGWVSEIKMRGGLLVVAVLLALLLGAEDPVEALDDALERPDVELHVLLDGLVLRAMPLVSSAK